MVISERLKQFHFMKNRKIYYTVSLVIIIVTIGIGLARGFNLGIDFTGGTMIQMEMGTEVNTSDIYSILSDNSLDGCTVTYAGENNTQIIIKSPDSLDTDARSTLLSAIEDKYSLSEDSVLSVSNIGPSVGETLRSSAIKAILVAIVLMLVYIAVRFMWKYGVAAILALCNTLLILIGFYGTFGITINSPFIAAILTILGYGINDTIVIFDRIRENAGGNVKRTTEAQQNMVDESIRQTVGRSLMTSLTTIAVMIPLLIFCGTTIRSFILPLLVGVTASTLSSIFIATSFWYDICRLTDKDSYEARARKKAKAKAKYVPGKKADSIEAPKEDKKSGKKKAVAADDTETADEKPADDELTETADEASAEKETESADNAGSVEETPEQVADAEPAVQETETEVSADTAEEAAVENNQAEAVETVTEDVPETITEPQTEVPSEEISQVGEEETAEDKAADNK